MLKLASLPVLALAFAATFQSCSSEPAELRREVIGSDTWIAGNASSLEELDRTTAATIVARVEAARDISTPALQEEAGIELANPNAPLRDFDVGPYIPGESVPSLTLYSLRVEAVFRTSITVAEGDILSFGQNGGRVRDVAYQLDMDPIFEVGKTYLIHVNQLPGLPFFTSSPWARFEIDDGRLVATSPWDEHGLPAVEALRGLTIEEARARIEALPNP